MLIQRLFPYLSLRTIVSILLLLGMFFKICPHLAYAEPTLSIADDPGVYSIEVYPLQHRLVVRLQGQKIKTYSISVGNPSTPTPIGQYQIRSKGKNWGNSYGPCWLGLNVPWGIYGIHGTNKPYSIGQHLSHGCIRMRNNDVIELYKMIPIGTNVTIYGHVLGEPSQEPRKLAEGDVGGEVLLIQSRLRSAGYFNGICNGKFHSSTTAAVKRFQHDHHLAPDGVVSLKVYEKLGLLE